MPDQGDVRANIPVTAAICHHRRMVVALNTLVHNIGTHWYHHPFHWQPQPHRRFRSQLGLPRLADAETAGLHNQQQRYETRMDARSCAPKQ